MQALHQVAGFLVWVGRRAALAYNRRALAERVGPMHPDRVDIERRISKLERLV